MVWLRLLHFLVILAPSVSSKYSISVSRSSPFSLLIKDGQDVFVENTAILVGTTNSTVKPVVASSSGRIPNNGGQITARMISPTVAKIEVNSSYPFVGAQFSVGPEDFIYGVWEYPFFESISNTNVSFDLKGLGNAEGLNWDNARAPFFLTSAGYGVYADALEMGSYDFTKEGKAQFIFNTSSLTYYVILPKSKDDFKSILEGYTGLSSRIEMPPTSGFGPTFWSDDFEQDFHAGVTNAQENYYDVVNHLYYNQIHASAMFADRPYGSGNMSFGNFDFDPKYYPTPKQFIANLSSYGFDFQVWVANRAFLYTELFNMSEANGWLFPGINPVNFLGPALNLSIPAAYHYFKERLSYFTSVGVKGYKIDRGEEGEMPVYEQNVQMTLFEQLVYENMASAWGPSAFYNFARSAVDRSRSRTAIWNGDSHSNFSGLAYSVASGIRAGLISFPVWGSDTGGYIRGTNDPTEELWARWMHYSAFSPVYELMLGTNHTPWYPPYTSDLVTILKQTANLHHDLLPFIKSHTYESTQTGVPLIRALFLEVPADKNAFTIADQYFFGSEFLVAPIVNGGGCRSVYFPKGFTYLEYFNKSSVNEGGTTSSVCLGLDAIPVYVRQGAIVPRGDVHEGNNKWTKDWKPSLTIEAFPSFAVPESRFSYFNGEGDNGTEVDIIMATDKQTGSVKLTYGDLGAKGKLVVYADAGKIEKAIVEGGGEAVFEGVKCLF
ncbi:glycoside hydrolase family 31 protein [Glonium stellatum]|uniref:Glycoside hydrolase family 31 protein n=1 Tax=Glonium stellatum TaxID=574774 RepID=A0A8E2F5M6_9PEZI|nr:glycoside hydrolase family 31 protein [Glonium stellatum]